MVLGSLCWAASVTVSAPPAPTATSMSTVSELPPESVKYGIVSAPAMSVAVNVLSVSVIENAVSATVKPPNSDGRKRPAWMSSMPSVPLKPAEPNGHVVEGDSRPVGHVDVDGQPVLAR